MKIDHLFKKLSISLSWLWLALFAIVPIMLVSLASLLHHTSEHFLVFPLTLENYQSLFHLIYLKVFLRSLRFALITTLICLIIAYPFAYLIATRINPRYRALLLLLVIIPFWTSSLLRSYALMILLSAKGLLNTALIKLGIIATPIPLLYTNLAVYIGLCYNLLPFMILPIYANLEKFDWQLIEAARDLGASNLTIFRRIIWPLSLPGVYAGTLLVCLPAMTLFYIPDLLGGSKALLLGNLIQMQFIESHNWPQGAATSLMLTILIMLVLAIIKFSRQKQSDMLL